MREITIPPTKHVQGVEVSFALFLRNMLETDPRFTRDADGARSAAELEQLVDEPPGTQRRISPETWARARDAAEKPAQGYPMIVETDAAGNVRATRSLARYCVPCIDAITMAPEVPEETA